MTRPRMQIIRGLPGSGKTSLAIKEYPDLFRLEMDMLFTSAGKYKFSTENFEELSELYFKIVSNALLAGMDFVLTGVFPGLTGRLTKIVSMALIEDYDVYIKTLTKNYGNTHGVPDAVLESMRTSFISEDVLMLTYHRNFGLKSKIHFGLMSRTEKVKEDVHGSSEVQSQVSKAT